MGYRLDHFKIMSLPIPGEMTGEALLWGWTEHG